MNPVYSIILYDISMKNFHDLSPVYIHKGKCVFGTGLKLNTLQNYCCIALDIFKENTYNKVEINSELEAWLTLLTCTDTNRIRALVEQYPMFVQIYEEIFAFRRNVEEVFSMYSEALVIADRNDALLCIEKQRKEYEEQLEREKREYEEQLESEKREYEEQLESEKSKQQELLLMGIRSVLATGKKYGAEMDSAIADVQAQYPDVSLEIIKEVAAEIF